jgi:hypothetical protein
MKLLMGSHRSTRSRWLRRGATTGLAALSTLAVAPAALAFDTTQVTGQTPDTAAGNQAETNCNVTGFNGALVETVVYNDNTGEVPSFIQYNPPSGREATAGFSGQGWSYRVLGSSGWGPWTHSLFPVPLSLGWDLVWGDPSMASNPDFDGYVFSATLAMPHDKFQFATSLDGTPGTLDGVSTPTTQRPSPIGGGCVFRSRDGGQTFAVVDCVRDTTIVDSRPISGDSMGHFYDGSSMAVTQSPGGGHSAFVAFIDTEKDRQAVWTMDDATSNAAHPFHLDSTVMGNVGQLPGEELGEIETHVRLAAAGTDLWEMSARNNGTSVAFPGAFRFDSADLEVNMRGRNGNAVAVAENAEIGMNIDLGADGSGNDLTVRTGPQFDLDFGLNERGDPEMRFVYVAADIDPVTHALQGIYLQAGYCAADLSSCSLPVKWRTPVSSVPLVYFPAIKYGVAPGSGAPSWKISYQDLNAKQMAIFSADLQRPDIVTTSPTFSSQGLAVTQETPFQTPCPDVRGNGLGSAGYWGDYDGMAYDATAGMFVRTYTDSTTGCPSRSALTSSNVHVSQVALPALGAPRKAVIAMSGLSFGTTGFNVFNCGSPVTETNQTVSNEDANGVVTLTCTPQIQPDGSLSSAVQHQSLQLGCGDDHGAWVDISCSGRGMVGDQTISGQVEFSISDHCSSDDMPSGPENSQTYPFSQVGAGQTFDLGFTQACDTFSNGCANSPCLFNVFQAQDATVGNTSL